MMLVDATARRRLIAAPIVPRMLGSQDVGRTVHYLVRALNRWGHELWVGVVHDPIDFARLQVGLVRSSCGGEPLAPDLARLCTPAWTRELVTAEGLHYDFRTVESFVAVGDHAWTAPILWADVATYNTSNSTLADWPTGNRAPTGVTTTDYLVAAGGGSGSDYGGGGAGGVRTGSLSVTGGTQYTITVGAGGTGSSTGANGSDSVFASITSTGGGRGGSGAGVAGGNGGSGGGSSYIGSAGTGTGGQGNNGGTGGGNASPFAAGGGGGANAVGSNGTGSGGGAGGAGVASSISGSSVTYGGGGGGGCFAAAGGAGGAGGGGAGGNNGSGLTAGTANRGGGGGGFGNTGSSGANGGSGVVILNYSISTAKYIFNMPNVGIL